MFELFVFFTGILFNTFIALGGIINFFRIKFLYNFYNQIFIYCENLLLYFSIFYISIYIIFLIIYFMRLSPGAGNPANRSIAISRIRIYSTLSICSILSMTFILKLIGKESFILFSVLIIIGLIVGFFLFLFLYYLIIDKIHKF